MCDLRMCNKSGLTDAKFAHDTFATNPYCSYNFFAHSTTNSRGVGILIKKSLNFVCLETKRDEEDNNFILIRARISNITVIIGSIYGPNKKDDNFFRRLHNALSGLGNHPTIIGGDWNATYSCLNVQNNPDVLFMQDVPNMHHSKKIRELCREFNLTDPYRVMYPNRLEYTYVPYGTIRKNRSRLDFFLISTDITQRLESCTIKQNTQSKLFDHKAIVIDFNKIKPQSSRPNISNSILRDPDLDFVVALAYYECYAHATVDDNLRNAALQRIGLGFSKVRESGPDPSHIEYMHANLLDYDDRVRLKAEVRIILDELRLI